MSGHGSSAPSPWAERWLAGLPGGATVLDLAAGCGRHARWLAARGATVLAVDRDAAALATLGDVAGVSTLVHDLEDGSPWPFAGRRFAAVVVTNYLHRPRLESLAALLAPDGRLVYETFMRGNERFGRPSNPAFLLEHDELLRVFAPHLALVAFEQGEVRRPKPAMVQRYVGVAAAAGSIAASIDTI